MSRFRLIALALLTSGLAAPTQAQITNVTASGGAVGAVGGDEDGGLDRGVALEVVAWEDAGRAIDGRAVLVADNPGRNATLAEAVLEAPRGHIDAGGLPEMVDLYQTLGDPAMRLRGAGARP
jgi:hypothetical protein